MIRFLGTVARCWVVVLIILVAATLSVSIAQTGKIEIPHEAPPPTEKEKKEAKRLHALGVAARTRLLLLGSVLRAQKSFHQQLEARRENLGPSEKLSSLLEEWSLVARQVQEKAPSVDTLKNLLKKAVITSGVVKKAPSVGDGSNMDVGDTLNLSTKTTNHLERLFDEKVVEHGLTNLQLRYYPFSAIVKQPFVECNIINEYSRNFRCLPRNSSATAIDRTKFCPTKSIQNFDINLVPRHQTWVRKGSTIRVDVVKPKC